MSTTPPFDVGEPQGESAPPDLGGVQEHAGELVDQAQERAQALAEQARSRAREQVDQRSSDLGQRVKSTAEDLRGVAEHLRSQDKDQPARVAEEAAARLASAGSYLERADGERILHDVETLGRERPWAAVVGGMALGLVASRFLKASSTERYRSRASVGTSAPGRYPPASRGTGPGRSYPSAPVGRMTSGAEVGGEA